MTDHKAQRLQHVAELLNAVGRDTETKILSTLEEANPNLASEIREKMFTFDDLTLIVEQWDEWSEKNDPEDLHKKIFTKLIEKFFNIGETDQETGLV